MTKLLQFLRQNLTFIAMLAPLAGFFLIDGLVDNFVPSEGDSTDGTIYFSKVVARVAVMLVLIGVFWKTYIAAFALKVDKWGIVVGLIGAPIWIGLCELGLETKIMSMIGAEDWFGGRSAVDPFSTYDGSTLLLFLVFRFALLVIAVPIAEELFLRGYFMRACDAADWESLPLNEIAFIGLAAGTGYGVLSHPSEFIAAAVWFSLVTHMMVRTNRFWNCVTAHAITNLILGIYICWSGSWHLW